MTTVFGTQQAVVPDAVATLLRDLIHERTGLYFDNGRFDLLIDKLRDRVAFHRCQSYLDYYYILKYEEKGPEEWLRVMDAFSVQETYFWREASQVETLVRHIVPAWFAHHRTPLKIWSAACASGEEPYTLAIALREAGFGTLPIEIHASDASEIALGKARVGRYRERSFRALPPALREKYFRPATDGWQLDPEIISRVSFSRANLVSPAEISTLAQASVIFCRNVFIYFSTDSIRRTVDVFAAQMHSPGYLFVGSSESLTKITPAFQLQELGDAFVYQRTSDIPATRRA